MFMGLPIRTSSTPRWRISSPSAARSARLIGAQQVGQALRGQAQRIADRQSDALLTEIQGEDAGAQRVQSQLYYSPRPCYILGKGSFRAMALPSQPQKRSIEEPAPEARHIAMSVIALGVAIAVLYLGRVFFITSMTAVMIAFILEPFVALLMRVRFPRSLASFVVCTIALLFLYVIGMGAYSQLAAMYADLPKYGERIGDIVDGVRQRVEDAEQETLRMVVPARQRQQELERLQAEQAAEEASRSRRRPAAQPPQPPPTGAAGASRKCAFTRKALPSAITFFRA